VTKPSGGRWLLVSKPVLSTMERLSSCYFCGTALDEPLGTYLLGSPDPAGSVTLCQTCREKLETVFDTAGVDAALSEREGSSPTPAGSTDGEPEHEGPGTDDQQAARQAARTDADGASDEPADATESESAWEPLDEARGSEAGDDEGSPDTADGAATADDTAEAPTSDDGDAEAAASGDGDSISTDADDILVDLDAGDTSDAEESALGGNSDTDADSTPEPGSGSADRTAEDGDEPAAQGEFEDTDGESGEGVGMEHRESLTREKFNKVIRLLQNREFPVDREQFVVVASNAYNLRRSECDKVIDVAIERGILTEDEESGELVRAE